MHITRNQLRRIIQEELRLLREQLMPSPGVTEWDVDAALVKEGMMVSLQPITRINRPEESLEARWMRIAGITEDQIREDRDREEDLNEQVEEEITDEEQHDEIVQDIQDAASDD